MGRYNRQRSPEDPATAIKDMIDAEEDATTHEERKRKDMKNNKNPKIQRKEEQRKIEEMEVESTGKAEENNNSIGSASQEIIEGRDRVDSNYQGDIVHEKEANSKEARVPTAESRYTQKSSVSDDGYVVVKGKLVSISAISDSTAASINEATQKSFPQSYKGKYKLSCKITSNNTTGNKGKSAILISTWCYKNKLFPVTVDMLKRDLVIVTFKELSIANKCLELCKNESNDFLNFFIDRRMNSCRGVITD